MIEGAFTYLHCPVCGSHELSFGYGLAYGGLGPYTFCVDCDTLISKHVTDHGECFNCDCDQLGLDMARVVLLQALGRRQ